MTNLPQVWRKIAEPNAGLYDLIALTGWDEGGDPCKRHVLYVVKSRNGYLNEAFKWDEVGTHWHWLTEGEDG